MHVVIVHKLIELMPRSKLKVAQHNVREGDTRTLDEHLYTCSVLRFLLDVYVLR